VQYIEATLEDVAVANRLAHAVLGRSLDELPPQSRRLLSLLDRMVRERCEAQGILRRDFRFHRADVRAATGWTDFQVRVHLGRLAQMEHVLVHRGGRGQLFEYELLYDGQGQDGRPFLPGLLDVEHLHAQRYDGNSEGENSRPEGPSSPLQGASEPRLSAAPESETSKEDGSLPAEIANTPEHAHPGDISSAPSYPQADPSAAPEVP
ncbi:MAG: hypothetical protein L0Y66_24440, partial [Myxococcaceae bacterium]|nr:hypothetical protein [Myxococcaceae bacterium]